LNWPSYDATLGVPSMIAEMNGYGYGALAYVCKPGLHMRRAMLRRHYAAAR